MANEPPSNLFAKYDPQTRSTTPPADLILRQASLEDVPQVAAILAARHGDPAENAIASVRERVSNPDHYCGVAQTAGQVVGFAEARWLEPLRGPSGWYLSGIVIEPAWRRRGLARVLTENRLNWIRARATTAYYFANARNKVSVALHRHFGFVELTRDFEVAGVSFEGGEGVLFSVEVCRRG